VEGKWNLSVWSGVFPDIYLQRGTDGEWESDDWPHDCVCCLHPLKALYSLDSEKGRCPRCFSFETLTGESISPQQ